MRSSFTTFLSALQHEPGGSAKIRIHFCGSRTILPKIPWSRKLDRQDGSFAQLKYRYRHFTVGHWYQYFFNELVVVKTDPPLLFIYWINTVSASIRLPCWERPKLFGNICTQSRLGPEASTLSRSAVAVSLSSASAASRMSTEQATGIPVLSPAGPALCRNYYSFVCKLRKQLRW